MENYINTVSFEGDNPVSSLDQKTLSEVKTDSRFEERLEKYCWRQIDGKDHNRLRHVFINLSLLCFINRVDFEIPLYKKF